MAIELAADKIRVNAINPVMGETALLTTFMGMEDTPENRAKFVSTIPLGRMSAGAESARPILQAIKTVPAAGPDNAPLTPDMGGRGGTQDLGRAIADAL